MQVDDAGLIDGAVQSVHIGGKLYTVVLDDIAGTAYRRGGIVTVLGYLVARTCNDETRCGGYIKSVLAVTACSHHIYIPVAVKERRNTRSQYTVTESQQFIHRHTPHLQGGKQGCDLLVRKLALSDAYNDIFGFLTLKFLVIQYSVQDVFHFHFLVSSIFLYSH